MSRDYRRIALLGSISLCAFTAASPALAAVPVLPANGIAQNADDLIAINIFDLGEADDPILLGRAEEDIVPGGTAFAFAQVLCADSASCTSPGALEQFAHGVSSANNQINIGGSLGIDAIAAADGATATAIAFIDTAIGQHAEADGAASNSLAVTGSIDILAAADATATQGLAFATALVTHAALLSAIGHDAAIEVTNDGTINIGAIAHASEVGTSGGTAVANALAVGIIAQAAPSEIVPGSSSTIFFASPAPGSASINVTNNGVLALAAQADAIAAGPAGAHATADRAIAATAFSTSGDAAFGVINTGSIRMSGSAHASGLQIATAGGVAAGAIVGFVSASGAGDANISVANSGTIDLHGIGIADATATAVAQAFAGSAILLTANAADGNAVVEFANSGSIAVEADASAEGDIAFAGAIAGGSPFAGALVGLASARNGSVSERFENSGDILVDVDVHANGVSFANASAFGGPGIDQRIFSSGGGASVSMHNAGLLALHAHADAAANTAFANASVLEGALFFAGAQSGGQAVGNFVNDGTLAIDVDANATGGLQGGAHSRISRAVTLVASTSAGTSGVDVGLTNNELVMLDVAALATGDSAFAFATVSQAVFEAASSFGQGPGNANLVNDGLISIDAAASAHGAAASAIALVEQGLVQLAIGEESATASLTNSGTIDLGALAMADGDDKGAAFAVATIQGIFQGASAAHRSVSFAGGSTFSAINVNVTPIGPGLIDLENEGSLSLSAFAAADGANATALAFVTGASQSGLAADLDAVVNNIGTIELAAGAMATASGTALASAQAFGLGQNITAIASHQTIIPASSGTITNISTTLAGDVSGQIDNSGVLSVAAGAKAQGALGIAAAGAQGIAQEAEATTASLAVANSGSFDVSAMALATGTDVTGGAIAVGLSQAAFGSESASVGFSNQNDFTVIASVAANGSSRGSAGAMATGVLQDVAGAQAIASVNNAATMTVIASLDVLGSAHADGQAIAAGIRQSPFTEDLSEALHNSGKLSVAAIAAVDADSGFAAAIATGYQGYSHRVNADIENSGMIGVLARAQSLANTGLAQAQAIGFDIAAFPRTGASVATGSIDGMIDNAGILHVIASADGPSAGPTNSQATAIGIRLTSGANNAAITNSGTIIVEALAGNGGDARAVGIQVGSNGFIGDGSAILEIDNSGTLIARQSVDGGETWHRGTAIDVSNAPNNSVVNLNGGSNIYGNIAVQDGDVINVANGKTIFDGIIGAEFLPTRTVTASLFDTGLSGAGALNIASGGNLLLVNPLAAGLPPASDGPAYAIADSLTVEAGGTLTFQLLASEGGIQKAGTYSQIFVNSASLAGSLVAEIATPNGLFADEYHWDNVIDANSIDGKFDTCVSNVVLLSFTCTYDSNSNVDLALTRVAFDAVDGLNRNGSAVASSIEDGFDPGRTDPGAAVIAELFKITDPANYNRALNQLSGSSYANYLQSFTSLGVRYDDLIAGSIDCVDALSSGSALQCREPASVRIWGQADFERHKTDGDVEAGATSYWRQTSLAGVDVKAGDSTLLGLAGGVVSNHGRDKQFGDNIEADGGLIGFYADYDPGAFFVKGVASYSWFDGDSKRQIAFGSLSARAQGDADASLFTTGIHGGARLPLKANTVATAYANLDFVNAKLQQFTERNADTLGLRLDHGKTSRLYLTGGVKLAGRIDSILPELEVGVRHRFGGTRAHIDAELISVGGDTFDIVSAAQDRTSAIVGAGLGGRIGPVEVKASYRGEFNEDVHSNSGTVRLTLALGKPAG